MKYLIAIILALSLFSVNAQENTEDIAVVDSLEYDPFLIHSPRKATIRSAIIPGWGQAYNKKYWKIPVVYAGLGTAVYFISWNNKNITKYSTALSALNDDDPNTINTTGEPDQQMEEFLNLHKRWRDVSYMALAGVYVLNIIDANVDAYLFHFDVNEDISLSWRPEQWYSDRMYSGLTLTLTFK